MMWGNLGSINDIDKAVPRVDLASPSWELVLHGIANAYYRSSRDMNTLAKKLHDLEGQLEDPASQSALHMMLGDHYFRSNETMQGAEYYEKVIAAQRRPFHVKRAKGMLREMSQLNEINIAPDFEAETLEGDKIKLSALKGRIVLLDFWSSSCGPCIPELAHLKKIFDRYDEKEVVIIGISKLTSMHGLYSTIVVSLLLLANIAAEDDYPEITDAILITAATS